MVWRGSPFINSPLQSDSKKTDFFISFHRPSRTAQEAQKTFLGLSKGPLGAKDRLIGCEVGIDHKGGQAVCFPLQEKVRLRSSSFSCLEEGGDWDPAGSTRDALSLTCPPMA